MKDRLARILYSHKIIGLRSLDEAVLLEVISHQRDTKGKCIESTIDFASILNIDPDKVQDMLDYLESRNLITRNGRVTYPCGHYIEHIPY